MGSKGVRFYKTREELLNALGMGLSLGLFYSGPFLSLFLCAVLYWSPLYPALFAYFIWMFIDRETPHKNGRRWQWVCSLWIYRRLRQYFPQSLVKTAELSPDQNYILCLFPHGISVTSAIAHFLTNETDFNTLFPGLHTTLHTLNSNFLYPFLREYSLFSGFLAVSKEALLFQLCGAPSGRAIVIVPGGSAEAMLSQPGAHRVALGNRKGFVKLAIITGTDLVPIYSFGETDLYDHRVFPRDSIIFKTQELIRKTLGVALVPINGGGLLQDSYGLLPRPFPVTTIVGKPIKVVKNASPTNEEIDALHCRFIDELLRLFDEHKHKYITDPLKVHLSIVNM